ncbi:MAG: OmpA family protein [Tannerella sp.]|jgi:hypothetical protein|nr:OmpA family protein [Tannerella sp.]
MENLDKSLTPTPPAIEAGNVVKVAVKKRKRRKNKRRKLWMIPAIILVAFLIWFFYKDSFGTGGKNTGFVNITGDTETRGQGDEGTAEQLQITNYELRDEETSGQGDEGTSGQGDEGTRKFPYQSGVAYPAQRFKHGTGEFYKPDPEVVELARVLQDNPDVKIAIYGYADSSGNSVDMNNWIAEKRAKWVYNYLISKGIEASRLSYEGKGVSTKYPDDADNRRTEFIIR